MSSVLNENLTISAIISLSTDELIRQVTINCAERGLLLLRVRDEIRMTIAAYQTLYESRYISLDTEGKLGSRGCKWNYIMKWQRESSQ